MGNPLDQTPYNFMQYVMTPPKMDRTEYEMYEPKTSQIRVMNDRRRSGNESGLGQVPIISGSGEQSSWVMPVVVIVVSAMALMTMYALYVNRR